MAFGQFPVCYWAECQDEFVVATTCDGNLDDSEGGKSGGDDAGHDYISGFSMYTGTTDHVSLC